MISPRPHLFPLLFNIPYNNLNIKYIRVNRDNKIINDSKRENNNFGEPNNISTINIFPNQLFSEYLSA